MDTGPVRISMMQPSSVPFKTKVASEKEQWQSIAREAINIIDENGDVFFQKEEVVTAMKMMGENGITFIRDGKDHLEVAEEMMNEVDVDGDGLIDIDECIAMMKKGDKVNHDDTHFTYGNKNTIINWLGFSK